MDYLTPILTALAGFVVAILASAKPAVQRRIISWIDPREKRERKYLHGLEQIAHLYAFFKAISQITAVDRVILFIGHNCGGVPSPTAPYWVCAIYGHSNHANKDPLMMYGYDIPVDTSYIEMLTKIIKDGKFEFITAESRECKLKSLYEHEGVKQSLVYYLGLFNERLVYMTVATYSEQQFNKKDKMEVEMLVERVRAFYEETYS